MHPSEAIRGTRSHLLDGKRIVVGVSGSIAATEVVRIIRELVRHGAEVHAVASREATRMISADALRFATGREAVTELTGAVEHVVFFSHGKERADLLLLAPATANTLSKIAKGIDDTPVTTCASMALGSGIPVMVAPAMHGGMMKNPFVAQNVEALKGAGVTLIPPLDEEGEAKLASPEIVAAYVMHRLAAGPWTGKKVLVVGGSTSEPIDDVRAVTNGGSGRLASELATHLFFRGANVALWMGECRVTLPAFVPTRRFRTTGELNALILDETKGLGHTSMIIVPAALSDFTVENKHSGKIDSASATHLDVRLTRTSKTLPELRRLCPRPGMVVGFKLESTEEKDVLVKEAADMLRTHSLDAVVANGVSSMGSEKTRLFLVRENKSVTELSGDKSTVAGKLLDALAEGLA